MQQRRADTGVLVVHGIGAQKPGETLNKLLGGLRRVQPDGIPTDYQPGSRIKIGGQPVRFYEVYWADLMHGDITFGAFQMKELQSLAWFPWFNYRRGNYRNRGYSWLTVLWWSLFLPVLNFFILFAYYGANFLVETFSRVGGKKSRKRPSDATSVSELLRGVAGEANRYSPLDAKLDDFIGDVFSYVNSAGGAFHREGKEPPVPDAIREVYPQVLERFYAQLLNADKDGCDQIQIVAHSLGTVVTYHALSGLLLDWAARADRQAVVRARSRVRHLYTIGSPLEKIRFFWPSLVTDDGPLESIRIKWDNFVSRFDPVAGVLRRYSQWGPVDNHHLLGGGFIRGHVVYEHSPVFIAQLTEGLCGKALPTTRTSGEKWRDRLILAGETLLAPLALLLMLVIGLVIFTLTITLLPYLISLLLRQFLAPDVWGPITDYLTLFFAAVMIVSLALAPIVRASQVHRAHWRAADGGDQ